MTGQTRLLLEGASGRNSAAARLEVPVCPGEAESVSGGHVRRAPGGLVSGVNLGVGELILFFLFQIKAGCPLVLSDW